MKKLLTLLKHTTCQNYITETWEIQTIMVSNQRNPQDFTAWLVNSIKHLKKNQHHPFQILLKNLVHSKLLLQGSITMLLKVKQVYCEKRKLQVMISDEHRCKTFPAKYEHSDLSSTLEGPRSDGILLWNPRMVQHTQTNDCNTPHKRIKPKI